MSQGSCVLCGAQEHKGRHLPSDEKATGPSTGTASRCYVYAAASGPSTGTVSFYYAAAATRITEHMVGNTDDESAPRGIFSSISIGGVGFFGGWRRHAFGQARNFGASSRALAARDAGDARAPSIAGERCAWYCDWECSRRARAAQGAVRVSDPLVMSPSPYVGRLQGPVTHSEDDHTLIRSTVMSRNS